MNKAFLIEFHSVGANTEQITQVLDYSCVVCLEGEEQVHRRICNKALDLV